MFAQEHQSIRNQIWAFARNSFMRSANAIKLAIISKTPARIIPIAILDSLWMQSSSPPDVPRGVEQVSMLL
jgi:hypothetical protein